MPSAISKRLFGLLTLLFLYFGFKGTINHSTLLAAFSVPLLPLLAVRSIRQSLKNTLAFDAKAFHSYQTLRTPLPWAALLRSTIIPAALFFLSNGRVLSSTDNLSMQLAAVSLVRTGSADISSEIGARNSDRSIDCSIKTGYFTICREDGIYPGTSLGMLLFAVPAFWIADRVGANLESEPILWRVSKWTGSWVSAFAIGLSFLLALHVGSLKAATWATLFLTTGSTFWTINGQGLWTHTGVSFFLLLSLLVVFRPLKNTALSGFIVGLSWGGMFACRLTSAPLIAILALWLVFFRRKLAASAYTGGLLGLALLGLSYQAFYGTPFGPQFIGVTSSGPGLFSRSYLPRGIYGLLLGPGCGLLIYQAWTWLLFAPLFSKKFRPHRVPSAPRDWQLVFILCFLTQFFFYACFSDFHGQWCWGTRYLSDVMPLLALLLTPILAQGLASLAFRRTALALGIVSLLIHFNGARPNGGSLWSENPRPQDKTVPMSRRVLDWRDPAFLYPLPRLF